MHILIVSFQIHCGGVQSQNYENCVNVQIFMDLTVIILWSNRIPLTLAHTIKSMAQCFKRKL